MRKAAVIIPFYQRTEGILLRAIESILSQVELETSPQIIVVDDQSPVSAKTELVELQRLHPGAISIVEQRNAGPGAARNTGLQMLDDDVDCIAFLDSDDRWQPNHLSIALGALELGYDFFFANYSPNDGGDDWFRRNGVVLDNYRKIDEKSDLYALESGLFDKLFTKTDLSPVGTPTIVYRREGYSDIRFPEGFSAGEDSAFTFHIAERTESAVFCANVQCICGQGVNISSGSNWETPGTLRQLSHAVFFRKYVSKQFSLSERNQAIQQQMTEEYRDEFVRALLHALRQPGLLNYAVVKRHFKEDFATVLRVVPVLLSIARKRLLG